MFKKRFIAAASAMMMVLGVCANASQISEKEVVVDEDFLSSSPSYKMDMPATYEYANVGRELQVRSVEGKESVVMTQRFDTRAGAQQALWGTVAADIYCTFENLACQRKLRFLNLEGQWGPGIVINKGKLSYETSGNTGLGTEIESDFKFEEGLQYKFRIVMNIANSASISYDKTKAGKYDIYINDVLIAENLPFVNNIGNVGKVLYFNSGEGSWNVQKVDYTTSGTNSGWTATDKSYDFSKYEWNSDYWYKDGLAGISDNGDKALKITSVSGKDSAGVIYLDTAVGGPAMFSADITYTGSTDAFLMIQNFDNKHPYWLAFTGGKLKYRNSSWQDVDTGISIVKGKKYNIRIYNDFASWTDVGQIYIDGKRITGLKEMNAQGKIGYIQMYAANGASLTVDNIKIASLDGLPNGLTVTKLDSANILTACDTAVEFVNAGNTDENTMIWTAAYDELDDFLGAATTIKTIKAGTIVNSGNYLDKTGIENISKLKVSIWNADTLSPIVEAQAIE